MASPARRWLISAIAAAPTPAYATAKPWATTTARTAATASAAASCTATRALGIGAAVAFGPRMGRFTFEASYLYLALSEPGPSSLRYGQAQRLGGMARVDVVRLGSRVLGANSMLALYGEIGAARQWHRWGRPGANEPTRMVPVDAAATLGVIGFGLNLDHRLEKQLGFPSRIGWQLGWQLTSTPTRVSDPMVSCRGPTCAAAPSAPTTVGRNTALLVTSTMAFTW